MKNFHVVLCALALSIVMLVAAAVPAAAAEPPPAQNAPVAWVSWGGSNSREKSDVNDQAQLSFLVKKLGDGTTVGHMRYQDRVTGLHWSFDVLDSYFHETNGVKVAEVFARTPHSSGYGDFTMYAWWIFTDGGEPGTAKDGFRLYAFFVPVGLPFVPSFSPPGPPPTASPPSPGWWLFQSLDSIPGGNIQIHIN